MKIQNNSISFKALQFDNAMESVTNLNLAEHIEKVADNNKLFKELDDFDYDLYVSMQRGMVSFHLADAQEPEEGQIFVQEVHEDELSTKAINDVIQNAHDEVL